jgi:ABC-2 type transport system permease protein
LSAAMSFRVNFILIFFIDMAFFGSLLFTVDFIYDHVEKIGVWNYEEFMFFVAYMLMLDHIHMVMVSGNFWRLSFDLRQGQLDFTLLKPIGSLFDTFFRYIRVESFMSTPVALTILIYHGVQANLSPTSWLLIPIFLILSMILLVSIEILLSMVMFWTIEATGINFLRMQLQAISRWPEFIYQFFARKLFTVFIPVLMIGSVPVGVLLEKSSPMLFLGFFAAIAVLWTLISIFWKLGLRNYESASS